MLNLDLNLCETGERFQQLCFRIARSEFPDCIQVGIGSWDNGIDILEFANKTNGEMSKIWQCKFTKHNSLSNLKGKIIASLNSLPKDEDIEWILCISVEKTGHFIKWLTQSLKNYPFIKKFRIWDKIELLIFLEKYPDILEIFFYKSYAELFQYFNAEDLHLIDLTVDDQCEWTASDPNVLSFNRKGDINVDILLDLILKNVGNSEAMLFELKLELKDVQKVLRGLPGEDLLLPKITYEISIKAGREGLYKLKLEPPLLIKPHSYQRFKIKICDVGFSWTGKLKMTIVYGASKQLSIPTIFISV